MSWRDKTLADKDDSRHAEYARGMQNDHTRWPKEPVSAYRPSDHYSEPRARFGGAILLLWVVAFIAISAIWKYFG
jgi:hypothetical protein